MNHWLHPAVKFAGLLLVAASYLIAYPASAQISRRNQIPRSIEKSLSLARSLDPRLQHAVVVLVSDRRLQEITQLDREAALASGKFTLRVREIARGRTTSVPMSLSGSDLIKLGIDAGTAERKLFLALKQERALHNRALKFAGPISLIQPLNLATIETSRLIRLRVGTLRTEIPDLDGAAVCRGDIVMDRMIYRYGRAVTAEDDAETTRALRDIQIQLACMSTQQIRVFESALIESIEWTDNLVSPSFADAKRKQAIRNSFRQLFAPIVFATADASRLFFKHDRTAIKWLSKHKAMLTAAALKKSTITYRVGLLIANRFTGNLKRVVGSCAEGEKKLFSDGRGGRTCNSLGALFQSVELSCDPMQWVPYGDGATKFVCDPACSGAPGSLKDPLAMSEGGGKCSYPGPGGAPGGGKSGPGGIPGGGSSGRPGEQGCDGVDPMFGVIGFQSPAQAYNAAFNSCLQSMANRTGSEGGTELSGYAPGGNKNCMLADSAADEKPTPGPSPETSQAEKTESDKNLDQAKELVKSVIDGFASLINFLHGKTVITAEDAQFAKTAVDNAKFGPCNMCKGQTSADGKEITIQAVHCSRAEECFNVLLHEGMHSALTRSVDDEEMEHAIMGDTSTETRKLYDLYERLSNVKSCPPDEPSCTGGCNSREAAAIDCTQLALNAYSERLREMNQGALDCATDACWNPANDDPTRGETCGAPDQCRGQSVALCMEDQPNCMCRKAGTGLRVKDALRQQVWNAYCAQAHDERCSSPTVPDDFGGPSGQPSPGPPPPWAVTLTRENLSLGGGKILIYSDGTVRLKRQSGLRPGADDPACTSDTCRASLRGDW